jgi:hypothetical protein
VSRLGAEALAGEFLLRYGVEEGAAELLARAVDAGEGDGQVHARLAEVLWALDDLPSAIEHYESAKRLLGSGSLVDSCLGIVLTLQGELDAAMDAHRRALAALPQGGISARSVLLVWNAAHTLLASGRLTAGWDAYEARIPVGQGPRARDDLPDWGAVRPDKRRVLVFEEQGVGDQVLFGSCLPDLLGESRHVCVECDPRLVPLFARSFPLADFGPTGTWSGSDVGGPGAADGPEATIALGSLPRRYRRALNDFPADGAYLRADPDRVNASRRRLDELPPGPRVGVSWRSILTGGRRRREYAPLPDWAPILARPGVQLVNLQYGDCEDELLALERELGITIARWPDVDLRNDLDGVAALIAALDAVVAPRNSVAHIAGAVGTATAMLANPHVWSDLGTDSLPWFPRVTTVYRKPGDKWAAAIERAAALLDRILAARSRREA